MELDERVDLVLDSPIGAQMFLAAQSANITPEDLSEPAVATSIAYEAQSFLGPWTGAARHRRDAALQHASQARALATQTLADPRNRWWWADLIRDRQVWVQDGPLEPAGLEAPSKVLEPWGHYAQHLPPEATITTSTKMPVSVTNEVVSGLHAELAGLPATDWIPSYPLQQGELVISPEARVWEVHVPGDWHRLSRHYGEFAQYTGTNRDLNEASAIDHGPAPAWNKVCEDWDGVHLSFFGFVVATFHPVTSPGLTTTLWAWPTERTMWLRNIFADRRELPSLNRQPELSSSVSDLVDRVRFAGGRPW